MSKIKSYIALFETDPQVKSLGVVLPQFPGFITTGNNFEQAYRNAQELLQIASIEYAKNGGRFPEPQSLEEIKETWEDWDEWQNNYQFMVVPVNFFPSSKPVKYSLYLDQNLMSMVDRVTDNRSRFFADAARAALGCDKS